MHWLYENYPIVIKAIITTFVLYVLLIGFVRLNGLRSFANMTSTDLVVTVLMGNVLSTAIMYDNQSIWKATLIIAALLVIQKIFSTLTFKSIGFRQVATNQPMVLVKDGELKHDNLKQALVSEDDLRYKLRKEGITAMSEVAYVIFETTGEISILQKSDQPVDDFLLVDIHRDRA